MCHECEFNLTNGHLSTNFDEMKSKREHMVYLLKGVTRLAETDLKGKQDDNKRLREAVKNQSEMFE